MRPYCVLIFLLFAVHPALADDCTFSYWEVIPYGSNCEAFKLPDFEFRSLPAAKDAPAHMQRFCKRFGVKSASGDQETGYCYTGEGDASGPAFTIGSQRYLADINFQGCIGDKKAEGIVFVRGEWTDAPTNLRRFWPVSALPDKLNCNR